MSPEMHERLHNWRGQRDKLIIDAVNEGIPVNKIHVITGIARTTIDRVIERATMPESIGREP